MQEEWDDIEAPEPTIGGAEAAAEAEHVQYAKATFWLPDPTSHSGWTLHHVFTPADHAEQRPMGFRRRR